MCYLMDIWISGGCIYSGEEGVDLLSGGGDRVLVVERFVGQDTTSSSSISYRPPGNW